MPYRPAFFAFPNDPIELRDPILAAVELVKANPDVSVTPWPNLPVFGAAIPDEVREGIEKAAVFVGDITRPNRNVYYEIGYSIGLGKALAPVLNVSFASAVSDLTKDGLFDIIGYKPYENSPGLAELLRESSADGLLSPRSRLRRRTLAAANPHYSG
jgi:hypothetical protein